MEVRFGTRKLLKCYENLARAVRAWGPAVARRYVERVNILYVSRSAADLAASPALRFHALEGDRAGEYSIRLDGFMRLIVTFEDAALTIVTVKEVSKHYGD